jgi:hypothetical protein
LQIVDHDDEWLVTGNSLKASGHGVEEPESGAV